ncbi:DUF4191 domain-containing protein [Mumia zhuanghuii]|jgi:hypothetical protein|uniref:DUF4191 domain-containing protein n=1 Tax=Mumia zhuanghuii TaxID=2585211 RepID=A0A5C4MQN9_9ACTN|nr:DUF4191 domain-containing protein [Mumia zhuanghuii]TNC47368.1 DUF4191 domain-containing protein [Mumia zhuanghuii]TNC47653.1 DUF4191 domain-containing protein [Mumia zhuanghuii]
MSTPESQPEGRIAQIRAAYKITKRSDRTIGLRLLAWFLVVGGAVFAAGWFLGGGGGLLGIILTSLLSVLTGFLVALIVFGRRAEKAAYAQVEGQVGAAAGALGMLKRGWKVDQAVAFNKSQDVVHRVVGPPGIVLVGEGNPGRVRNLLTNERKKTARIVGEEVPITLIVVGKDTEKGEVPLPKLVNKLRKTKRVLKPAQITPILNKLKALDAMRPQAPLPRGPVPSSAKGARRMMQGR